MAHEPVDWVPRIAEWRSIHDELTTKGLSHWVPVVFSVADRFAGIEDGLDDDLLQLFCNWAKACVCDTDVEVARSLVDCPVFQIAATTGPRLWRIDRESFREFACSARAGVDIYYLQDSELDRPSLIAWLLTLLQT